MNKDKTIEKGAGFTPGPWVAMGKAVYTESDNPTREILWGGHNTRSASNEEKQANARLIAQAPAMYEQCKLLEGMLASWANHDHWMMTNCNMLTQLRELLANVDGGEG